MFHPAKLGTEKAGRQCLSAQSHEGKAPQHTQAAVRGRRGSRSAACGAAHACWGQLNERSRARDKATHKMITDNADTAY